MTATATPTPIATNTHTLTPTSTRVLDIATSVTADPEPVAQGGTLTYAVVVHNFGPANAPGSECRATLSPQVTFVSCTVHNFNLGISCTANEMLLGAIPNGQSATMSIVVAVSPGAVGPFSSTVLCGPNGPSGDIFIDTDRTNDSATVTSTILGAPPVPTLTPTATPPPTLTATPTPTSTRAPTITQTSRPGATPTPLGGPNGAGGTAIPAVSPGGSLLLAAALAAAALTLILRRR